MSKKGKGGELKPNLTKVMNVKLKQYVVGAAETCFCLQIQRENVPHFGSKPAENCFTKKSLFIWILFRPKTSLPKVTFKKCIMFFFFFFLFDRKYRETGTATIHHISLNISIVHWL